MAMTKPVAQIVKPLVTAFFETLSAAQDMAGDSPHVSGQKPRARDLPTLVWTHSW